MDETIFWNILEEILGFGEFVVAVPNWAASANIVGKISIGRDGKERVIDKDSCHCHIHLEPEKIIRFFFTNNARGSRKRTLLRTKNAARRNCLAALFARKS